MVQQRGSSTFGRQHRHNGSLESLFEAGGVVDHAQHQLTRGN